MITDEVKNEPFETAATQQVLMSPTTSNEAEAEDVDPDQVKSRLEIRSWFFNHACFNDSTLIFNLHALECLF